MLLVRPGVFEVLAKFLREHKALITLLFPTLDLPEKNTSPPAPPLEKESPQQDESPRPLPSQNNMEAAPNWTLDEAREQLKLAQQNRDNLTDVLLRFGLCCFEFVGLFSVIQGKAQGFSCAGKGAQEGFLHTKIELASPGIFHSISQTTSAYFGPPPQEPRLQRFLLDIQRRPRSIFIYPITVGDKLVAIFYGDSGQNSLQQKQFANFTLFCQQLPAAFHELLWVRRKQTIPTAELDEIALRERLTHAIGQLFETDAAIQNAALEMLAQTPEASAKTLALLFPGPQSTLLPEDESLPPPHSLGPISHALLQLGDAGAQALKPLLSSEDKKLRCAALKLAGYFASPQLLEAVSLALVDTDSQVASTARTVLPHFKILDEWPQALHLIQHSLNVKDPLRRTLAAKAVVAAKDRGSIETLIQWTGDVDVWVAETAAWALQQLSCIHIGPSPNLWKRWWTRAQHERRVEWLVCALESESFEQRKQAIDELSCTIGDTFHFRADASEEERQLSVQCWQQFVAQNPNFDI
jgi:HEAT repeat protein